MLDITADKVAEVIILAREEERGLAELQAFVEALSVEEQAALVAVFWVGRGSFDVEDFDEAVRTAQDEASTPTAEYLMRSPHLAEHLEAGLDALGISATEEEDALYRSA